MSVPVSVASTAEAVLRDGDIIDALRGMRHNKPLNHLLAWQGVASFLAGAGAYDILPQSLPLAALSYVPLGLAALVPTAITYATSRSVEGRKLAKADRHQRAVRELLQEPVDLVVLSGGRGRPELALRWKGLDEVPSGGADRGELADRLTLLLERTADARIDTFVLGATGIYYLVGENPEGEFGRLVERPKDLGPTHNAYAPDEDQVLHIATREQCHNIIAALRSVPPERDAAALRQLLGLLTRFEPADRLARVANGHDLTSEPWLASIAAAARAQVLADLEAGGELELERDSDGNRARVSSNFMLSGDRITRFRTRSFPTGETRFARDSQGLLERAGHGISSADLSDGVPLEQAADTKLNLCRDELLALARHVTAEANKRIHSSDAEGFGSPALTQEQIHKIHIGVLLLTRRMQRERGRRRTRRVDSQESVVPRTDAPSPPVVVTPGPAETFYSGLIRDRPRTSLTGSVRTAKGRSAVLRYYPRREALALLRPATFLSVASLPSRVVGKPARAMLLATTVAVAIGAPWLVGISSQLLPETRVIAQPAHAAAATTVDGLRAAGVSDRTLNEIRRWLSNSPRSGSPYGDGASGFGDTNLSDAVLFNIKGLGGASTQGYWYTHINNVIDTTHGAGTPQPVLRRSGTPSQVLVPAAASEFDANIRYAVTAPLPPVGGDGVTYVSLPLKAETSLAAFSIAGVTPRGESKVFQPILSVDSAGMYEVVVADSQIRDLRAPMLRYWLKQDPEAVPRAGGPMLVAYDGQDRPGAAYLHNLSSYITPQQRARVLAALGLPPSADAAAIQAAIHRKEYSYTPLADAGLTSQDIFPTRSVRDADWLVSGAVKAAGLDSSVCNLADLTYLVGSGGSYDGRPVNAAEGFLDNGEGKLRDNHRHVWPVDVQGEIHDPTPTDAGPRSELDPRPSPLAPVKRAVADNLLELLAASAGFVRWRRNEHFERRKARRVLNRADRRMDGARADGISRAVTVLDYLRYAPADAPPPGPEVHLRERELDARLRTLVSETLPDYETALRAAKERGVKLDRRTRRALREVTEPRSPLVAAAWCKAPRSGG